MRERERERERKKSAFDEDRYKNSAQEEECVCKTERKKKEYTRGGEGKITYLLSATFRRQFISNKRKQEMLTSFLRKVVSFSAVKYDLSRD